MDTKVLLGLSAATLLLWIAAMAGGPNVGFVLMFVGPLTWLVGMVLAVKARDWGWAFFILLFGAVPGLFYAIVRLRGPAVATQPISVLRG